MSMTMEAQARKIRWLIRHCLGSDSAFYIRIGTATEVDQGEQNYEFKVTIEYKTTIYFLTARGYTYGSCEVEIDADSWVEITPKSIYMYLFSVEYERSQPLHTESK